MKALTISLFAFPVLLVVGVSVWWALPTPEGVKAKRVTRAALSLPTGSAKDQVASLLQRENIEASYVGDKEGIDFTSDVVRRGYSSANLSGYYVAIIRNTSKTFIGEADTQYFFFFDKKGKLLKATAQEQFIGL